ncbi:MerR family transcriptional regulator [Carnobacterium divergens]|uniref:MerR family transcriptional regulator n=1 Tax=Carnobacterium divergens TaxID=2748 RepID=A0AAW8RAG5_CARDV|nr:MerR family transcriptional regulator [Carnobacterium divergens]MDT1958593.1 MerR family transcriptional regulator [Carnobacterium divergens]MDT1974654.1 MerR family transcriptional regulator [Carnobacterium divergens]MDT2011903.1 MerR family transcriptional regulator [Carnobacterium divergens]
MYKIGEFSKLSTISVRMLRHYDQLNLLNPQLIDTESGYRYYSSKQLKKVNKIQRLKELGFSLSEIKEMLTTENSLQGYFEKRETEVEVELEKLAHQKKMLQRSIHSLKYQKEPLNYHVQLKYFPEQQVVSLRSNLTSYQEEGKLWSSLYEELAKEKVNLQQLGQHKAIFHDKEYKEKNVDVEIQASFKGELNLNSKLVQVKKEPTVKAATVIMNGSYHQVSYVTESIACWIEDHQYKIEGKMFNIYHVSPTQEKEVEKWVTEICFPIV